MNQHAGNPIYYYHQIDSGRVIASLRPIPESETFDYLGKRYLFAKTFYSVRWRYDQPPLFFDHKIAAGCVAACHDTERMTHEIESPLTVSFLSDWTRGSRNSPGGPIVFTDEDGGLTLTFKRRPNEPIIDIEFNRMFLENHEWDDRYFEPQLSWCGRRFEKNESWHLSSAEFDSLVSRYEKDVPPDPILTFFDPDNDDEERIFSFRYL